MGLAPVLARIALRYASMGLVSWGYLDPETAAMIAGDEELVMLAGAGLAALTEAWWVLAERKGWRT